MEKNSGNTELEMLEDARLWDSFKQGNARAYALIYERYVRLLFSYGSKISSDRDLVKDCIHDLFYYLWEHKANLGHTHHISYYLFKSLRRGLINKLNKSHLDHENISVDYHFKVIPSYENEVVENQDWEDDRRKLTEALGQLPGRQKEAIYLKYYHDLSFEEIASVMAVNRRSVYKLVDKALHNLQKNLSSVLITLWCILALPLHYL